MPNILSEIESSVRIKNAVLFKHRIDNTMPPYLERYAVVDGWLPHRIVFQYRMRMTVYALLSPTAIRKIVASECVDLHVRPFNPVGSQRGTTYEYSPRDNLRRLLEHPRRWKAIDMEDSYFYPLKYLRECVRALPYIESLSIPILECALDRSDLEDDLDAIDCIRDKIRDKGFKLKHVEAPFIITRLLLGTGILRSVTHLHLGFIERSKQPKLSFQEVIDVIIALPRLSSLGMEFVTCNAQVKVLKVEEEAQPDLQDVLPKFLRILRFQNIPSETLLSLIRTFKYCNITEVEINAGCNVVLPREFWDSFHDLFSGLPTFRYSSRWHAVSIFAFALGAFVIAADNN